jgi:hypothetical protein
VVDNPSLPCVHISAIAAPIPLIVGQHLHAGIFSPLINVLNKCHCNMMVSRHFTIQVISCYHFARNLIPNACFLSYNFTRHTYSRLFWNFQDEVFIILMC